MSKIAAARSFGAKGVVAITLERPTYQPGETLVGYITLRVDKGFNAKELQVAIIGDELVTWEIAGEQHERSRNWLRDHQVIAAPQRYEPGDYVFPFQFLLPYDLPNSFEYQETRVYDIADVHACVGYTITASLPVLGPLNSDLGGSQGVRIACVPREGPRAMRATHKKGVGVFDPFDKGYCVLTASLASNFRYPNEKAEMNCTILNHSKKRVKQVSTELVQVVEILPREKSIYSTSKCRTVSRIDHLGMDAGQTRSIVLQPEMVDEQRIATLLPTLRSQYIRISYHLEVKTTYSVSAGASVSFPITILPVHDDR
ncbi:hypothetical protein Poli38472_014636 [Pythium oligandrum]|uniref:Arrestin C-terminal-like domain-containing protein n=1 Tax=Pythium oligandrum TaxID=41045 RepID=A0A8K1FIL0_PYTOL|nr:hypothetical protein Poli38472_014636 [Pythium oligandrum]|eukprot:TMW63931.1 hypothetical protein Poli38472_014636 [Pythium oligandrum]